MTNKRQVKKISKEAGFEEIKETPEQEKQTKFYRSKIVIAIAVLIVLGVLYYAKGLIVVAVVNGEPLSRIELTKELQKQSGKQVLDAMVTKSLIYQEAAKKNISISDSEVNDEVKKIEKNVEQQGQKLDDLLSLQGMTRNDLKDQIKIKKMVEKLAGSNISVTDKEVEDYMKANKIEITDETKKAETINSVKQQLIQKKSNDKIQVLIEELKSKAKIQYFVQF